MNTDLWPFQIAVMNSKLLSYVALLLVFVCVPLVAQEKESRSKSGNKDGKPFVGIQMRIEPDEDGIRVEKTMPGSPASQAGVLQGDVIKKVGATKITTADSLAAALGKYEVGGVIELTIQRGDKELKIEVVAGDRKSHDPRKVGQTITFPSEDGLDVTADLYLNLSRAPNYKQEPFIVLCHQAGWSRGEYLEIAPKLVVRGFSCLAIDQRSGNKVNDVQNETAKRAKDANLGTTFPYAEQDMIAALKWARANHAEGKLLLWGSSYSASLALRIAGEHPELVDGVLSFAPGEYFEPIGKPNDWIESSAKKIKDPVFVTSAKFEFPRWDAIYAAIPGDKVKFLPTSEGNHGSRALFEEFDDSPAYWKAVDQFLKQFKDEESGDEKDSAEDKASK